MPILCTAVLLSVSIRLNGTERHWIARGARLIVVETFHQGLTYLCIDGWHVSGVIDVNETLLGAGVGRRLKYRFLCGWDAMCRSWPAPRFTGFFTRKGIWFLDSADRQTWTPPGYGGMVRTRDSGRSRNGPFEHYIRLYRR